MTQETTPGWLVAYGFVGMILVLAIAWTSLPWPAAILTTAAAFLGSELGMSGARWHDERERRDG